ncbi:MAG: hypothetical protein ACREOB_13075 [Thermodesulfobacteriota bacterium]
MKLITFRRVHEVLARDIEITELREAGVPIHRGWRDMFGRAFIPYATLIPDAPLIGCGVRKNLLTVLTDVYIYP